MMMIGSFDRNEVTPVLKVGGRALVPKTSIKFGHFS